MQSIFETDNALTVTAVNNRIRKNLLLDSSLSDICVVGETNNVTYHPSGHIYFSLKDADSLIQCTFFKQANRNYQGARIEHGEKYYVFGSISTYIKRGGYQLNITNILPAGRGAIFEKIEKLKQQLYKEGLFDPQYKKPLPAFAKNIGLVTALTGAALQDILSTLYKRNPHINILIASCLVQGDAAPLSIIDAIQELNKKEFKIEIILVSRGGGSSEDLMAYNDERLIRAMYQSRIPIVSAVGHEIDHSLSDLVADSSAKTPTAGAILVVSDFENLCTRLEDLRAKQKMLFYSHLEKSSQRMLSANQQLRKNQKDLQEKIQNLHQQLDEYGRRQKKAGRAIVDDRILALQSLQIFQTYAKRNLLQKNQRFQLLEKTLQNLNPREVLKRGYAIVINKNKEILKIAADTKVKEKLDIILHQGQIKTTVTEILPSSPFTKEDANTDTQI